MRKTYRTKQADAALLGDVNMKDVCLQPVIAQDCDVLCCANYECSELQTLKRCAKYQRLTACAVNKP